MRGGSRDYRDNILRDEVSDENSDDIAALVADIAANYRGAEFGKYRVVSVGNGTLESIMKRLGKFSRTEIVYLIVEKNDG